MILRPESCTFKNALGLRRMDFPENKKCDIYVKKLR